VWTEAPRRVAILGCTGSIGRKAVAVARRYPERFQVVALSAYNSFELAAEQAALLGVSRVVMGDAQAAEAVRSRLPGTTTVEHGPQALADLASLPQVDLVVNGVVGRAGLEASLAAASAGKILALANKESLVLAGELLMSTARGAGAHVLPVDSEHSGLFQALEGKSADEVAHLLITASGGPFRGRSARELADVTPEEALNHPVWPMGPRITVDSATLFNKGLEVIETHHLFDVPLDRIQVWVHPQSVVHALVRFRDSSILAQLSAPDMMLPVQYAMSYPERWDCDTPDCALPDWGTLEFEQPARDVFGALDLAYETGARGGTAPTALNAADEIAVEAFLARRIRFPAILDVLRRTLDQVTVYPADSLEAIDTADREAREVARQLVTSWAI